MPVIAFVLLAVSVSYGHTQSSTWRVVVDGAKTPSLISDTDARRHFVVSLASPDVAQTEAVVSALTKRLALSQGERRVLLEIAENARVALSAAQEPRGDGHVHRDAAAQHRVLDELYQKIVNSVEPATRGRIDAFVATHVKTRVKVYAFQ